MGSDTLADAPQWKDFAEIERLAPPLIIPRAGHGPGAGPAGAFALPDVSSTVIRERLAESVNTAELKQVIPGSVLEYIVRRRLFQANPQPGDS
jgi:nicotinic acid mononucleotide adenylyltransferase